MHEGGGQEWGWVGAGHCQVGCGPHTFGQWGQHQLSGEAPARWLLGLLLPDAEGSGHMWAPVGHDREVSETEEGTVPSLHWPTTVSYRFIEVCSSIPEQPDHLCIFLDDSDMEWGVAWGQSNWCQMMR